MAKEKSNHNHLIRDILIVAVPAMLTMLLQRMMDITNIVFAAKFKDPAKIAGIGLSNMYVNIVCGSVILGLNGGIATLVA